MQVFSVFFVPKVYPNPRGDCLRIAEADLLGLSLQESCLSQAQFVGERLEHQPFCAAMSHTAKTVDPLWSHCCGDSIFCAHVGTFRTFRLFLIGSIAWKH